MRGGLQSPVDGWAVFETVEPGSELLTFASGEPRHEHTRGRGEHNHSPAGPAAPAVG